MNAIDLLHSTGDLIVAGIGQRVNDAIPPWLKSRLVPGGIFQLFRTISTEYNYGTNPFDRDWDVLVVVDACRYDLFKSTVSDHPIRDQFDAVDSVYSCASATNEWLTKLEDTTDEILSNTFYISGSGHIDAFPQFKDRLQGYEDVWEYGHDSDLRTVPAGPVTNAAIRAFRTVDADRFVVHYVQPHAPFVHCVGRYGGDKVGNERTNVWELLERREVDEDDVWEDYEANLRYVLDDVQTLIENATGRVVVTSDHGNALGEWGLYGHPIHHPFPVLRKVPWATGSGGELETYDVKQNSDVVEQTTDTKVREHLQDLGYLE
jgi:hypothetical protein